MTESKTTGDKTISVGKPRLSLKRGGGVERDSVRQTFSHGRTNTVQVERKKRRVLLPGEKADGPSSVADTPVPAAPRPVQQVTSPNPGLRRSEPTVDRHAAARAGVVLRQLPSAELA